MACPLRTMACVASNGSQQQQQTAPPSEPQQLKQQLLLCGAHIHFIGDESAVSSIAAGSTNDGGDGSGGDLSWMDASDARGPSLLVRRSPTLITAKLPRRCLLAISCRLFVCSFSVASMHWLPSSIALKTITWLSFKLGPVVLTDNSGYMRGNASSCSDLLECIGD